MSRSKSYLSLIFLILLACQVKLSAQDLSYQEKLLKLAQEQKLEQHPQWLTLLHYKKSALTGNYKSLADDQKFFLAGQRGKRNPKLELEATIKSFFMPVKQGELHPQCQFVARYQWLKDILDFDENLLKKITCPEFDEWYTSLNVKSISLIFPTAYLNNPASAFGHTLLRLNLPNQTNENALLAYTANYAAATQGENAILYAAKGVFGGYKGFFSVSPYYELVNRYSDIESRDIWEYQLNFTDQEVDLLIKHLWELRSIAFDYYYFDENCSYHILALLDVARPSLGLINDLDSWVLPLDTVRFLRYKGKQGNQENKKELVDAVKFRASKVSKLQARIRKSSLRSKQYAQEILKNKKIKTDNANQLNTVDQARGLDLAYDFLSYKERFLRSNESNSNSLLLELLNQRSQIDVGDLELNEQPDFLPENGHGSMRLSVGRGRRGSDYNQEFRLRPVYHSLLDAPLGYTSGAQIEFMDFNFALSDQANLSIEKFNFVDIISLNNVNSFLAPTSWSLTAGAKRSLQRSGSRELISNLDLAFGRALEFRPHSFLYGLLSSNVKTNTEYDDNYAFGNGLDLGLVWNHGDYFAEQLSFKSKRFYLGDSHTELNLGYEQRVSISKNKALRFSLVRDRVFDQYQTSAYLYFDYYL